MLNGKIKENNQKLDNLNNQLIVIEREYKEIKENIFKRKTVLDGLKKKSIRKDTQINDLANFLKVEENNIKKLVDELNLNNQVIFYELQDLIQLWVRPKIIIPYHA